MKKLLIVDNSLTNINTLNNLFFKRNIFTIYSAKSLEDAKKLINKEEFFLVISNTKLATANNKELLELLKSNSIPTVIINAKIDNELIETFKDYNVVDYILENSTHGFDYLLTLVDVLIYTKDLNVLVVSKVDDTNKKIKHVLETLLLNVTIAKDGAEALDIIENELDISLLICDYDLPLMNGLELSQKLIESDKYHNLPILINNYMIDNHLKINFYKIGINDFLQNPILEEDLKAKVIKVFLNIKQINQINTFNKIFDENIISSSTDTKGVIKSVSSAFCRISGYSKNELIGKHHNIVRHPDMSSTVYKDLWETIKENKTWKGEIKNLRKDGSSYWVSAVIEPIFDKQKNKTGYYAVRQDITDKKRIYELSITDGLTSLYNRRYFDDIAKSIIDKTVRSNEVFAFMILDIDNFKKYNDTYGHQDGDDVLIKVSNSLKETFKRSDDLIFRIGGEEFGILINAKRKEDILYLASLSKSNIQALNIEHKGNDPFGVITASFGLIIIELENMNLIHKLDYIYKEADNKLYEAKEDGRNNIKYKII